MNIEEELFPENPPMPDFSDPIIRKVYKVDKPEPIWWTIIKDVIGTFLAIIVIIGCGVAAWSFLTSEPKSYYIVIPPAVVTSTQAVNQTPEKPTTPNVTPAPTVKPADKPAIEPIQNEPDTDYEDYPSYTPSAPNDNYSLIGDLINGLLGMIDSECLDNIKTIITNPSSPEATDIISSTKEELIFKIRESDIPTEQKDVIIDFIINHECPMPQYK